MFHRGENCHSYLTVYKGGYTSMEYERKGVTIHWQIENVKYVRGGKIELCSPVFSVDVMDGTKWKIVVQRIGGFLLNLTIKREAEDNGPEEFKMYYEFSAHALHRTFSHSGSTNAYTFQKDQMSPEVSVHGSWMNKENSFQIPDTIIIRCKIWRQEGSISKSENLFAGTRLKLEHCIFISKIENFSNFSDSGYGKKTLKTVSSSTGEKIGTVYFFLFKNNLRKITELGIGLDPTDVESRQVFKFKLFILDSFGNKTDAGNLNCFSSVLRSGSTLPNVSKEELLKKAAVYLPNDTLSLYCKITFSTGNEYETVEGTRHETDTIAEVEQTAAFSNASQLLMTREGNSCDIKLKTATDTLPAHSAILKDQSPVFEAKFKNNMKETVENYIPIDDVDAETLKRMLVFLYSETMEEIEWKDAMKLYVAADKYQIFSLKNKCATLLQRNIDLSNCCVLYHLADMHQDDDLKEFVHSYIEFYDKFILYCDQWKKMEVKHPHLAVSYFRDTYLGKQSPFINGDSNW